MKGRYATPLAFKKAIEQRLRNEVAESGIDLQRRRQLLVFDRYLARVFGVFGEAAILKGGLVLELRLANARTTKDVDLGLVGDPEEILLGLQEAGRLDLEDHMSFKVGMDLHHPVIQAAGLPYEGRRYRAETYLAGKIYGVPFRIDIALAEPLVGRAEILEGSSFLSFAGFTPARFRVYPVEAHLAEKLHAFTLPRERLNSRVKDLPDLALLASVRPIEAAALRIAIDRTFENRDTHPVPKVLPQPPAEWKPVYARLADSDDLAWKSLDELTDRVRRFLDPILDDPSGCWDPQEWTWRSSGNLR
jgi:predicted nucleotidyltransferase component of viral defense system